MHRRGSFARRTQTTKQDDLQARAARAGVQRLAQTASESCSAAPVILVLAWFTLGANSARTAREQLRRLTSLRARISPRQRAESIQKRGTMQAQIHACDRVDGLEGVQRRRQQVQDLREAPRPALSRPVFCPPLRGSQGERHWGAQPGAAVPQTTTAGGPFARRYLWRGSRCDAGAGASHPQGDRRAAHPASKARSLPRRLGPLAGHEYLPLPDFPAPRCYNIHCLKNILML
jgi:hypothetical protein